MFINPCLLRLGSVVALGGSAALGLGLGDHVYPCMKYDRKDDPSKGSVARELFSVIVYRVQECFAGFYL